MFINGLMDLGGGGHLAIILRTGGRAFVNENSPRGPAFDNFYQLPGVCFGVCPGGMLTAGIDPHIRTRIFLKQEAVTTACTRGFLRSFVAGNANFCSHLLASLVHFTVVKSQAILIIRLGVTEVIYHSSWGRRSYFRRNFIPSASFKTTKLLPRWICSGTTVLRVDSAYGSSL